MALLRNRNNLVTVRLSMEEYEWLKHACDECGARSMSDFVREVIAQRASSSGRATKGLLTGDLASIAGKLEDLDIALKDLSDRIVTVLGTKENHKWEAS